MSIEAEKLTGDNIYKVLIYFDKLYSVMNEQEKRQIMESLISEIQIYPERPWAAISCSIAVVSTFILIFSCIIAANFGLPTNLAR